MTLLEGPLRLIRGAVVYTASEGAQVRDADVIETGEGGFAQIEWADGGVAALAGKSRLFVRKTAGPAGARPTLILLDGWLKDETRAATQDSLTT